MLALIILVAAFTVVATLIMIVLEKKKEIAVLKAMGASDDGVLRIFLYQGGFIGGIGTALGLGLGVLVCKGLLVYAFPLDPEGLFHFAPAGRSQRRRLRFDRRRGRLHLPLGDDAPRALRRPPHPADGLRAQ